jgi:outer membrane receptor protein involved in Fe transport
MKYQIAAALLFCVALSTKLGAQNPTATLVGITTDPSGAVVVGAMVEIRNVATNGLRKAQSDAKGEFIVPNLAPGYYDITVAKDGFRTLRQTNLELQLDQEARLEFHLELGAVSQTVEVSASIPLINTENSVKGDVVSSDEMLEMPLISRDFTDLAFLTPGVVPNAQGGASSSPMVINGARADSSNFLIDGYNDRDPRDASPQVHPNIDALQEFKMQVSGYSADTGRQASGVMSMVLKTGGNQFHGTMFEFLRNDALNARNFFDAASPSVLRRNQFGATLSGPVRFPKLYNGRDRTFFLFSWESVRQNAPSPMLSVVATLAERQGNFAGLPAIKDPLATGTFFPNNQIPLSLQSSAALAAQAYYPLPNRSGVNNFYADPATPSASDNFVAKIDQRVTQTGNLSFRYLRNSSTSLIPYNGGDTGMFGVSGLSHNILTGFTYTQTFSPRVVNEARVSLARTYGYYAGVHSGINYNAQFGMTGGTTDPKLIGFPCIVLSGYDQLGEKNSWPGGYTSTNYNFADTITWVKGSHLIKFGGDILRSQMFQNPDSNERGTYNFTGSWTNQSYGDFLLGLPNSTSREVEGANLYIFTTNYSFFLQDDWKVTSRLTLNLGLRYELTQPPYDKYNRWTNFIPELNKLVIASEAVIPPGVTFTDASQVETAQQAGLPRSLVDTDYKDFAPRFGFAWRPLGGNRTVVRGGYGIFYGGAGMWVNLYGSLGGSFPFSLSQTINRNANSPTYLTLANPFPVAANLASSNSSPTGFDLHDPTPYAQNWNLTVEQSLGRESAIEIGYAGSKGTHLGRTYNINESYDRSAKLVGGVIPYPQWGSLGYYNLAFDSSYNVASVTLRRRFSGNFFYRVNYSYSKSIDYGSQLTGNSAGGYSGVEDARNIRLERGRSDFDIPHQFTTAFSWVVPWKHNLVARGWQLAGTGIARTGAPFTPQLTNANLNLGEAIRPNRIAKGTIANPTVNGWFDLSAFPSVPDGSFAFGNSGRSILDGPRSIVFNLALYRNFAVRERSKLQFRWEAFNAFNHTNFNLPVDAMNATNVGTITAAGAPRQMQVALKCSF